MSGGGGDDHGSAIPKFAIVGGCLILLVIGVVKIALPVTAEGTCATLGWGCSVPARVWEQSGPNPGRSPDFGGTLPQNRPPANSTPRWVDNGRNDQCDGRPKNVTFTCVSPISGKTVNCVCR